jgi:DNA (cytosine-5)-methyltransferase 1
MAPVTTLDLFSGIGGLTLATEHVCRPAGYVEINFYSQQVLKARMADGSLPRARLYDDIRRVLKTGAVEMLVGGFPCQDISSIGLGEGIVVGSRSGLFYEILRLCDVEGNRIQVLFLENVANILKNGGLLVVQELLARGFDVRWMIHSAAELGAPHVRKRWFCLAVRGGFDLRRLKSAGPRVQKKTAWPAPTVPRAVSKEVVDSAWPARLATLGNSVVPAVARSAFDALVDGFLNTTIRDLRVPLKRAPLETGLPVAGMILGGSFYPIATTRMKAMTIESKPAATYSIWLEDRLVTRPHLPTPRHGNVRATRKATLRTLSDLGTVLVHSEESKMEMGLGDLFETHVPNPEYVEWMMGYTIRWTMI